jgi:hypothetical protein
MGGRTPVVRRDAGQPISGSPFVRKVERTDTDGHVTILQAVMPPGELVEVHTHTREDEVTCVVAGEIGALVGDDESRSRPGRSCRSLVACLMRCGTRRTIRRSCSRSSLPLRLRRVLAEAGQIFTQRPPEPGDIDRLAGRYGETFDADRTAALAARHGLRVR